MDSRTDSRTEPQLSIGLQLHPHSYLSLADRYGGVWGEEIDALGLEKALRKLGHRVTVFTPQVQAFLERNRNEELTFDAVINFHAGSPITCHTNMRILYFQEFFSRFSGGMSIATRIEELLSKYDVIATPAEVAAAEFGLTYIPLGVDCESYYPDFDSNFKSEAVFIGRVDNRTEEDYRQFLMPFKDRGLSIYGGAKWLSHKELATSYCGPIGYEDARKAYSSANRCISIHHPDLRRWGLVTSRVFHLAACRAIVLSDDFPALRSLFGDSLNYIKAGNDIKDHLTCSADELEAKANAGYELVQRRHTFAQRAMEFLKLATQNAE
jgi:hypothetical protein